MTRHARISKIAAFLVLPPGLMAQNLTGTLVADDTGAAIPGGTVVAIQKEAPAGQSPLVYLAQTGAAGQYGMTLGPGQYQLCAHGGNVYLDPCKWGGALVVTATSTTAASAGTLTASIRLQRGGEFVVRIHDGLKLLPQQGALRGAAVSPVITSASGVKIPLPMTYEDGNIRDYGMFVPLNVPMNVTVTSSKVALTDAKGSPLSSQGIPFTATPPAAILQAPTPPVVQVTAPTGPPTTLLLSAPSTPIPPGTLAALTRWAPPPEATFIHVYVASLP